MRLDLDFIDPYKIQVGQLVSDPGNPLATSFDPFDRTPGSTSSLALHDDKDIVTFSEADHRALFRYRDTPEGIQVTRILDKHGSRASCDVVDVCAVGAKTCKLVNADVHIQQLAKEAQRNRDGALYKWLAECAMHRHKVFVVIGLVLVVDPKATDYSVNLENADIDGNVPLDLVLQVAGGNLGAVPDTATRREYALGVKCHGSKEARGEGILFAHYQELKLTLSDISIMGTIFRRRSSAGSDGGAHEGSGGGGGGGRPHGLGSLFHRRSSTSEEIHNPFGPSVEPTAVQSTAGGSTGMKSNHRLHLELGPTKFWATLSDVTTPVSVQRQLD